MKRVTLQTLAALTSLLLASLNARAELRVVNGEFRDLAGLTEGRTAGISDCRKAGTARATNMQSMPNAARHRRPAILRRSDFCARTSAYSTNRRMSRSRSMCPIRGIPAGY